MSSKTLKQTVENIESMVRDIVFEMKGETKDCDFANSLVKLPNVEGQPLKSAKAIPLLTDEDLKKILIILNNCVYPIDGQLTSEQRSLLYDINGEISWKIADILDINMNDYYYDIKTLELKPY